MDIVIATISMELLANHTSILRSTRKSIKIIPAKPLGLRAEDSVEVLLVMLARLG
jgi:hypothetical protein